MEYHYKWIIRFSITDSPYGDDEEEFKMGEKLFELRQISADKWAKKQGLSVDGGWGKYSCEDKVVWKLNLVLYQDEGYDRLSEGKARELLLFVKGLCNEHGYKHDENFEISPYDDFDITDKIFNGRRREGRRLMKMGRTIKRKKGMGRYGRRMEKWGKRQITRACINVWWFKYP